MLYIAASMQTEFIDNIQRFVFYNIEITVITFSECLEACFFIPFSVLHSYILSRNHFAIKQNILCTVLPIISFNHS